MAAKFNVFLTLVLHVLLLLYSGRLCVISSTIDGQPLIDRAKEKLDDMTLSMIKFGYSWTARILHANLERIIHECGFMRRNITIFAPRDEAMVFAWYYYMPPFPVQILIRRVEEGDFWSDHMVKGTHLYTCEPMTIVNVNELPKYNSGRLSIGNARILHENIYQDDLIIVHGVDSFFDVTYSGSRDNTSLLPWFIPFPPHLSHPLLH